MAVYVLSTLPCRMKIIVDDCKSLFTDNHTDSCTWQVCFASSVQVLWIKRQKASSIMTQLNHKWIKYPSILQIQTRIQKNQQKIKRKLAKNIPILLYLDLVITFDLAQVSGECQPCQSQEWLGCSEAPWHRSSRASATTMPALR